MASWSSPEIRVQLPPAEIGGGEQRIGIRIVRIQLEGAARLRDRGVVVPETKEFPGAVLAIQGRSIHSPAEVSVAATVDGRHMKLRYRLTAADWGLIDPGAGVLDAGIQGSSPSIRSVADRAPRTSPDVGQIEWRRLFEPSPGELRDEAAGRIYIYEGLPTRDIERAMDEEFKRVQSMMFIRVKPRDDNGNKAPQTPGSDAGYVQDDGC